MNNIKRLIAVLLVLASVFAFAACTSGSDNTTTTQKPQQSTPSSSASQPSEPSVPGSSSTQPTPPPTEPEPTINPDDITFRVRVVDQNGDPIQGMMIQLCKETCTQATTNSDGWAYFTSAYAEGYTTNLLGWDEGYEANYDLYNYDQYMELDPVINLPMPAHYPFEAGSMEFVFTITKL